MVDSHYEKYGRKYYLKNKEKLIEASRLQKLRTYKTKRDYILKNRYGIEEFDYNKLLTNQNGVCAICKQPPKENKRLDVDHCHTTKKLRGLLCNNCNRGLGHFKDSQELLLKAKIYLINHEQSQIPTIYGKKLPDTEDRVESSLYKDTVEKEYKTNWRELFDRGV